MTRPRILAFLLALVLASSSSFAGGRQLAPPPYGTSPYRAYKPTVASAGGRFLTVWREDRLGYGSHIVGVTSDPNGKRSLAPFIILPNVDPEFMQLVGTGDGYMLFWAHRLDQTDMVELDLNGRVLSSRRLDLPYHIARDIAWNGTHFLIAFKHSAGIFHKAEAMLFTKNGEVVQRGILLEASLFAFDVEVTGGEFAVIGTGFNGMYAYRITTDGRVTETVAERKGIGNGYLPLRPIVIARGEGTLLLVWSAGDPVRQELKSSVLNATGVPGPVHVLRTVNTQHVTIWPMQLMPNGGGYLLTYIEPQSSGIIHYGLATMQLDANGARVGEPRPAVTLGTTPPVTATNGTVTLVADSPGMYLDQRIRQQIVDAAGNISEPETLTLAYARQRQPLLGAGAGRFVAAFNEVGDARSVRVVALDSRGEPWRDYVLAQNTELVGELAWSGSAYLALLNDGATLSAVRLDPDGFAIGDRLPLGASWIATRAAATWATDRWLVVWSSLDKTHFASVSPAGVVIDSRDLPSNTKLPDQFSRFSTEVAVAADGPRALVVFVETQMPPCMMPICHTEKPVAWATRIRLDGTLLDAEPVRVGDDTHTLSIATSGSEFVVVADSPEATQLTAIDDTATLRVLASRTVPAGLSDIIWDGRDFVLAQRHRSELPNHLVVFRLDGMLRETAAPRGIVPLAADEREPPSIAAVTPGDVLIALQEGNPVDGARAVVYAERDLEPLPDWPPPRRRSVR